MSVELRCFTEEEKNKKFERIVRLCEYMLILHLRTNVQQNSLQLNPSVTEKKRLCLLWRCKHSVNLRAYWLLSNYAGT